jgi:hypothetical protein
MWLDSRAVLQRASGRHAAAARTVTLIPEKALIAIVDP